MRLRRTAGRAVLWAALTAAAIAPPGLAGCTPGARGNAETVSGTIERIDPAGRTFSVRDDAGAVRSFRVDADAGIDLRTYGPGDTVTVTLARSTPPNMISAADRLRKGDALRKNRR